MRVAIAILIASLLCQVGLAADPPKANPKSVYTLYRSSAVAGESIWRLHVATFDAVDGAEYNRDNCEVAKQLFESQPGVTVTYWCERGYFRAK